MRRNKLLLGLICLCVLGFVPLDWSRLFLRPANPEVSPTSNALKLAVSFLAMVMAWRSAGHGLSAQDERTFRRLFTLAFVADACFLFHLHPVGVLLFAVFQLLLASRNLSGWRASLQNLRSDRAWLLGVCAAVTLSLALTVLAFYRLKGLTPLLAGLLVYLCLLWASVNSAWAAVSIRHWPEPNARRMGLGMLCFLACDITIAGTLAFPVDSLARVVASSLTWMFYTPALVFIVLSAYRSQAPTPTESPR